MKSPFAFDITSAGSRVDSTLKMIGLKGEAISPVPRLSAQSSPFNASEFHIVNHRNNLGLEDFEGRCCSEDVTCDEDAN